jgi:hypothetical protein
MRINNTVGGNVREDMVGELVLAEGVEEESLPPVLVQWKIVKEDKDHQLDLEDGDDLSMKSGDHSVGLGGDVCLADIIAVARRRRRGAESRW